MNPLQKLTNASRILAEVSTAREAKDLKDTAAAAKYFARKKGLGQESIQYAHSIMIDAERKMGEILKATQRNLGAKGSIVTGNTRLPVTDETPTLADLGISKRESAEAQALASLPQKTFDAIKAGEKTRKQVKREIKEQKRELHRKKNMALVESSSTPDDLKGKFSTIVIDPPWDWGDEGDADQLGRAKPTYATMPISEIKVLPVAALSDTNCHIYLWITNRSLPKGFDLLDAWDFRYITCLTWCKPSFGMGNYFRGSTEQILFGVKGSQPLKRKNVGTWFSAPRGKLHSNKPVEFYKLVESCSHGPYLEMFSRSSRDGWTVWGAET